MDLGNRFYASVISIIRNANIDLMYAFNTTDYRGRRWWLSNQLSVKAGKYGNVYKFHINRDEIWVEKADILLVLQQLEDVLKSRTFF